MRDDIFRVMKGEPVVLEHLRYPLLVSPKLNGVRGYVRNGRVLSTANLPLPNTNLQAAFGSAEHLDGEFIVGDPRDTKHSLNRTTSIVMSDEKPIDGLKFYVFDHVADSSAPFRARSILARESVKYHGSERLVVIEHELINNEKELLAKEIEYLKQGYEGLITRDPLAPYKFGKSTAKQAWMGKMKRFRDAEAEVVGFTEEEKNTNEATISETGRTKRSSAKAGKVKKDTLGSVLVRTPQGVIFGVGTGFTADERAHIWKNKGKYLGALLKYKFFEAGSDGVPVLPVFLGWRDRRDR